MRQKNRQTYRETHAMRLDENYALHFNNHPTTDPRLFRNKIPTVGTEPFAQTTPHFHRHVEKTSVEKR